MKTAQLNKQLQQLHDGTLIALQGIAENIRSSVIIPYCEKHRLDFCTGMGCCFFTDIKGTHLEVHEVSKKLDDLLSQSVLGEDIADYIESYNSTQGHYATYTMQYSKTDKPIGK